MPPTCDPFEDLNRDLTPEEINDGLDFFDTEMNIQNQRLQARHHSSIYDQAPLDRNRQRITLFARFDLAKGMHIGMELQERIVAKLVENNAPEEKIPELLIAGNGSVDDPDRLWMIDEMMALRHEKHGAIKDYIKVLGVSHNYAAVNALMRTNMFAINPSTAEGFEHRATESIIKGVPAIVSNRGGLPLQVKEGVSGLVLNLDKLHNQNDLSTIDDELERAADFVVNSIIHPEKYEALKASTQKEAEEFSSRDIGTVSAVTRYAIALQGRGNRSWLLDDLMNHEEPLAA
jgi:glycosyltransferase involved in cell wall biosynthesis